MPYDFLISNETSSTGRVVHCAQLAGSSESKFVIGYSTMYQGNTGLFNTTVDSQKVYKPADYESRFGFWSYFIYPTAKAESKGSFSCLNTYDRAKFTFSFMQYAAHVPNGDFVKFLKNLLTLPNAGAYFPKLIIKESRIFYKDQNGTLSRLEDDNSTMPLMNYFNPSLSEIERQELICSARMVHWATNDPEHRRVQVETAIEHFKKNMVEYDKRFELNQIPAKVCQLVCDIRHQGRAKNDRIAAALNTGGDFEVAYRNLLTIGDTNYAERIKTIDSTISELQAKGLFSKKYNASDNSFIDT
ncbi:MAG: hypothetical protein A3H98_10480 [Bacteroidetes bacterium RIFCSPLOWO2_02_FULL_36_8]|nr:MAG: hypothetical protein A3H98_10480 [Bacteroidetes bacterium RIFCSPLOWO2_02_FULL_36_8]OFY70934.1 MAG: hypothetical protein A3G23_12510 [Bacteroidetes bacterium RIFCSPLOWO2_12_FULL_37_12]